MVPINVEISNLEALATLDTSKVISCYGDSTFEDEYHLHLHGCSYEENERAMKEAFPGVPFARESSLNADEIWGRSPDKEV